jgi:hypothetical protein
VLVQTLLPKAGVERLNECIVRGSPPPTEVRLNTIPLRPLVDILCDELRPILHLDPFRKTLVTRDPPQGGHDIYPVDLRAPNGTGLQAACRALCIGTIVLMPVFSYQGDDQLRIERDDVSPVFSLSALALRTRVPMPPEAIPPT